MAASLLTSGDLSDILGRRLAEASARVEAWPPEEIRFDTEAVAQQILAQFVVEPIVFRFEELTRSPVAAATIRTRNIFNELVFVPSQKITFTIPFDGWSELLKYRASTRPMGRPLDGSVGKQAVTVVIADRNLSVELVNQRLAEIRQTLEKYASWANSDVSAYNDTLRRTVNQKVADRKQRLDAIANLDAALDIPITPAPGNRQLDIPVARKNVRIIDRPEPSPVAEPRLSDAIYEDVLRTLISFGRAMERLPLTSRKLDEEEIRDLALFLLNANYEGAAAGEVFHGRGKNDILLTYRNREAFIGEFKFWGGPAAFRDAVDQLLSYTIWRDTKAALVLLVKNVRPTTAIEGADRVLREHPQFQLAKQPADGDIRRDFLLRSNSDPDRHIQVALVPVVIPDPAKKVDVDEGENGTDLLVGQS